MQYFSLGIFLLQLQKQKFSSCAFSLGKRKWVWPKKVTNWKVKFAYSVLRYRACSDWFIIFMTRYNVHEQSIGKKIGICILLDVAIAVNACLQKMRWCLKVPIYFGKFYIRSNFTWVCFTWKWIIFILRKRTNSKYNFKGEIQWFSVSRE